MRTTIYRNLEAQFNKLFAHNRQGSYRTRHRYAEACKRLLVFLAEEFRLEKLSNVAPKHIYAYVDRLTESGKSPAYIKTELSAIRFWHDQIANPRYDRLPGNTELCLARRTYGGVDRTWSESELERAVGIAARQGRADYIALLSLGRHAALRLHECFRIDTQTAEVALKTNMLTVKGKGGLVREVPLSSGVHSSLREMLGLTPRGHKLFVRPDDKTHLAMRRFESFISRNKEAIQDPGSTRPLHFHGLRHTCAAEWYRGFIACGNSEYQARKKVARLLGHGRDDVTRIYLPPYKETLTADNPPEKSQTTKKPHDRRNASERARP